MTGVSPLRSPATFKPWHGRLLIVGNFLNRSVRTRTASEELAMHLTARGFKVLTTSQRVNRAARMADMLWTIWSRRHEYTVAQVAVFSGPAFVWAEAACALLRRLGKPYILCLHGGNLPLFARSSGQRVRRLFESAPLITAPSRYLKEQLSDYRQDIVLVPNSIELDCYPYRLRSAARPKLVWLRAFHKIYNPSMAILVAERLVRRFPDLELVMVGREKDGSLAAAQSLVRRKGLERNVTIVPGIDKSEVPERLASADIFLNTASVDNTPVSVIEGMACGLCVVSTNPGGIPYMLEDGEDSLIVPVDDPGAMAAAVERILDNPALAERLSGSGRRKVEDFDAEAVVSRWSDLLDSVTGGKHQ